MLFYNILVLVYAYRLLYIYIIFSECKAWLKFAVHYAEGGKKSLISVQEATSPFAISDPSLPEKEEGGKITWGGRWRGSGKCVRCQDSEWSECLRVSTPLPQHVRPSPVFSGCPRASSHRLSSSLACRRRLLCCITDSLAAPLQSPTMCPCSAGANRAKTAGSSGFCSASSSRLCCPCSASSCSSGSVSGKVGNLN